MVLHMQYFVSDVFWSFNAVLLSWGIAPDALKVYKKDQ